jgi:NADH-quinone oxidoreductase subunit G
MKITIDGKEIIAPVGMRVIQACELAGIEIPRFCYHEKLAIAGNCRMCLVEIEKMPPKPVASCAMPIAEGMVIHTNSPMVQRAREGVMEFLLINHPLDCPICDEAGECDLQDQVMKYGKGTNRFEENKRAVADKDMGPLIATNMTRCIHCTRCIRFATDIAGVEELATIGRGEHMEVTAYVGEMVTSELSGNMIDICPVGALTSKPYAFKARSWELKHTNSICVLDAVGSNIRIDTRGKEVMRIVPHANDEINEDWISNKSRFSYDALKVQRLDRPFVKKHGKFEAVSWDEAMIEIGLKLAGLAGKRMAAIVGDLADCEAIMALKDLMTELSCDNIDCRQNGVKLDADLRAGYLFNTTIIGIEQADMALLIGAHPRYDATLVNARLRKNYVKSKGSFKIWNIGEVLGHTYPVEELGNDPTILHQILDGSHPLANILETSAYPMIIVGEDALTRQDGRAILELTAAIAEKYGAITPEWNGFNVLHKSASSVGALDLGFVPSDKGQDIESILQKIESGEIEFVYLLGADEIDPARLSGAFVVYQGHHGDRSAHLADVILPGAAYTEKNATYVNLEGRVQRTRLSTFPPGIAKEDWTIIQLLAQKIGITLPYNSLPELRARMEQIAPHFACVNQLTQAPWSNMGITGTIQAAPIITNATNYYLSNSISRASKIMASCAANFKAEKL